MVSPVRVVRAAQPWPHQLTSFQISRQARRLVGADLGEDPHGSLEVGHRLVRPAGLVVEVGEVVLERGLAVAVPVSHGYREILASVREWLAVGMRVDPAAERLFVHPNTVRYRMCRYEELTGADLHETEDAFRVWWALQREQAIGRGASQSGIILG